MLLPASTPSAHISGVKGYRPKIVTFNDGHRRSKSDCLRAPSNSLYHGELLALVFYYRIRRYYKLKFKEWPC